MTFFGQAEFDAQMQAHYRRVMTRSGLKFPPAPKYKSPGLPPTFNVYKVRTPK